MNVSLEDISRHRTVVSLEANILTTTLARFADVLGGLQKGFSSFTSGLFKKLSSAADPVNVSRTSPLLKTIDYINLMPMRVNTPPGFKGSYAEYSSWLVKGAELFKRIEGESLTAFASWVSNALANPAELSNVISYGNFKGLEDELEEYRKGTARFFTSSNNTKSTFGAVVPNNVGWELTLTNLNNVIALQNPKSIMAVKAKVEEIDGYLETLIKRMTGASSGAYECSPATKKAIADHCYAMAKQIELYAVYHGLVLALATSANDFNARLAEAS